MQMAKGQRILGFEPFLVQTFIHGNMISCQHLLCKFCVLDGEIVRNDRWSIQGTSICTCKLEGCQKNGETFQAQETQSKITKKNLDCVSERGGTHSQNTKQLAFFIKVNDAQNMKKTKACQSHCIKVHKSCSKLYLKKKSESCTLKHFKWFKFKFCCVGTI